ncbi:MAG: hypothetical protein AAFR76_01585 [Planctomycetota bacterium]
MRKGSLSARLVLAARERGDCATAQLAEMSGRSDRSVRTALEGAESRQEQLLRLHIRSATPAERLAVLRDVAAEFNCDVVILEKRTEQRVARLITAAAEVAELLEAA